MEAYKKLMIFALISVGILGCKKDEKLVLDAGTVNVTNAVIGGSVITLIANQGIVSASNTIALNNFAWMPIRSTENRLTLQVPAVAATATTPAIPAVTYYDQPITITSQSNYSLFLTGISPAAVEPVLINETYPYAYTDSTCGVRFINLAPGSNPISVNIKTQANGSEVATLAYKAYTDFNKHIANSSNKTYIFEFRDAAAGTLITTYTLTTPFFHNVTLCLRGKVGGSVGVILTNNY